MRVGFKILYPLIALFFSCGAPNYDTKLVSQVHIQSVAPDRYVPHKYKVTLVGTHNTAVVLELSATSQEANSLKRKLKDGPNELTHSVRLLEEKILHSGYNVMSILINGMDKGVYTAQILTARVANIETYDVKAIDAISISIKTNSIIYVANDLAANQK